MKKIYFIAGEASGDLIGASLIKEILANTDQEIKLCGLGGDKMQSYGFKSLFPISEISLIGFFEAFKKLFSLIRKINQTVEDVIKENPDMLITIDSPGFCFRVAKKVKSLNPKIKLLHYVAPTVWAYKPQRAKKVANIYDALLTLFPFENQYFEEYNLPTYSVGHPIFEQEISIDIDDFKKRYNISSSSKVITATPGSREGEIITHLPVFLYAVEKLSKKYPDLVLIIPTINDSQSEIVQKIVSESSVDINKMRILILSGDQDKFNAMSAADAAIAKIGTNNLEFAACSVPFVACYKMHLISWCLIRPIIRIKYGCLINICANKRIIPELLQFDFNIDKLHNKLLKILEDKNFANNQIEDSKKVIMRLGFKQQNTPSQTAAKIVLDMLKNQERDRNEL